MNYSTVTGEYSDGILENGIPPEVFTIYELLHEHKADKTGMVYTDIFGTCWSNNDNMMTGRPAFLQFIIELYKRTGDEYFFKEIMREIAGMELDMERTPTHNYALYSGRLAAGLSYLELYKLSNEKQFLDKALQVARAYYAGRAYNYMIIDDPSLYHGLSGIIWYTVQLFLYSGETWLLSYIDNLVLALFHKIQVNKYGMQWGGVTNRFGRNTGLMNGASGISLLLHDLGRCTGNELFFTVARQAVSYEDAVYENKIGVRHNLLNGPETTLTKQSLGYGIAGMALTRLYLSPILENRSYDEYWNAMTAMPALLIGPDMIKEKSFSLDVCGGLSGIGLAFAESRKITGNCAHGFIKNFIAGRIIDLIQSHHIPTHNAVSGLMHAGYFLLTSATNHNDLPGTIFTPVIANSLIDREAWPRDSVLKKGTKLLSEVIIRNIFKSTFSGIKYYKLSVKEAFDDCDFSGNWLEPLSRKLKAGIESDIDHDMKPEIVNRFNIDSFLLEIVEACNKAGYTDESEALLAISHVLEKGIPALLPYKLILSDKVYALDGDGILDIQKKYQMDEFVAIMMDYGTKTTFFRLNATDRFDEKSRPGSAKIIIDRFREPKSIETVQDEIIQFLLGQREEILDLLKSRPIVEGAAPAENNEQLIAQIKEYIQEIAWSYLIAGYLELA